MLVTTQEKMPRSSREGLLKMALDLKMGTYNMEAAMYEERERTSADHEYVSGSGD